MMLRKVFYKEREWSEWKGNYRDAVTNVMDRLNRWIDAEKPDIISIQEDNMKEMYGIIVFYKEGI